MMQKPHGWIASPRHFHVSKCFGVEPEAGVANPGMNVGRGVHFEQHSRSSAPSFSSFVVGIRLCVLRVAWAARERSLFSQSFPYRGDSLFPGLMCLSLLDFSEPSNNPRLRTLGLGLWIFPRAAAGGLCKPTSQFQKPGDLINAHERVHFRKKSWQLVTKPLGQTAGNDQPLAAILHVAQLHDSRIVSTLSSCAESMNEQVFTITTSLARRRW